MEDIRLVLKENIKLYRKRRGLTQQSLAEVCDVTTTYIGEIEIGKRYPSLQLIETLASVLDIEPWKLFLPEQLREESISLLLAEELRESVGKAVDDVLARNYHPKLKD